MNTKERPILFSGPMVCAILAGRKSQTRRVVKPVRGFERHNICRPDMAADPWAVWWHGDVTDRVGCLQECPYGKPGERIRVRETFCLESCRETGYYPPPFADGRPIRHNSDDENGVWWEQPHYRATDPTPELDIGKDEPGVKWRPSIFMPRWASRITLEVTGIRVERVQDISDADAQAEGMESCTPADQYRVLWNQINGKSAPWASNPWVWVIQFSRVQ